MVKEVPSSIYSLMLPLIFYNDLWNEKFPPVPICGKSRMLDVEKNEIINIMVARDEWGGV